MKEYIISSKEPISEKIVSENHNEISSFMKKRSLFNHITAMFKVREAERADNYQAWIYNEDYYLWIRMYLDGCKRNVSIRKNR